MRSKHWFQSKTMWLNILGVAISVFAMLPTSFELSKGTLEVALFIQGVLTIVLRAVAGDIKNPLEKQ